MGLALEAAASASHATSPNPMVGAVIARGDEVIAIAAHQRAGGSHAEALALAAAGERSRGADLFVTLEPCNHQGRTPPCTEAIIRAGLGRCVVAMLDPNPRVDGRGVAALEAAGIPVEVGLEERAARRLNEFYAKHVTTGVPFVTVKLAMSLDGRIATRTGDSRWITSTAARDQGQRLRHAHDAILVGANTIAADDPRLTTRAPGGRSPLRVVVDSTLRVSPAARVFGQSGGGALIATTDMAPRGRADEFQSRGIPMVVVPSHGGRVDLRAVLEHLGRAGIISVLIEGGGQVTGSAVDGGLVDKVVALIAPRIIGGELALPAVAGRGVAALADAVLLEDVEVGRAGSDLVVTCYYPAGRRW